MDNRSLGRGSNPTRAENWFEISSKLASPSQLSYHEYTECTLFVGRQGSEEEDWSPTLLCWGKENEALALHIHGLLRAISFILLSFQVSQWVPLIGISWNGVNKKLQLRWLTWFRSAVTFSRSLSRPWSPLSSSLTLVLIFSWSSMMSRNSPGTFALCNSTRNQ